MIDRPHLRHGTLAILLAAVTACDSGESETIGCPDLSLNTSAAQPMDTVRVAGLPAELGDTLFVEVLADTVAAYTVIEPAEDGARLTAPVHPNGSLKGGAVELRIGDGQVACAAVPFDVQPLEPAPGTARAVVGELQSQLDARLRFLGVTRAELRTDRPDTLAGPMVGLRIANFLLDHSAAALSDDERGQEAGARTALLDALWAKQGATRALRAGADTIRARGAMPPPGSGDTLGTAAGQTRAQVPLEEAESGGWGVHMAGSNPAPVRLATIAAAPNNLLMNRWDATPTALSELMWQAFLSDLQTSGSTAQFTDNLETALALAAAASVVVNPLAAAGFAAAGTAVVANRIMHEAFANMLPRRFTNMEVDAYPLLFEEDHPGPGSIDQILVTAASEGWRFDATIVSEALGSIPVPGGKAASKLSNEVMDLITGPIIDAAADASAGNSNIVSIPPQFFGPVDISDREWRRINIIGDAVDPIAGGEIMDYAPRRAGDATLRVATAPNKFGLGDGQYISKETQLRVAPIGIGVDPPSTFAEPAQTVTVTAEVTDALDQTVAWTATNGGVVFDEQDDGLTGWVVKVRVPDPFEQPVQVKAMSVADRSHLTSAPERSGAALIRPRRLTIRPGSGACVPHGETRELGVAEMDERDVRWSASAGSISRDGVFTAPGETGQVVITAVSREDPRLRDEIEVGVADACASPCTFEAVVIYDDPHFGTERYDFTGRATINDNHHTLRLVEEDNKWDYSVDIEPLDIGGPPVTVTTRGSDGLGWDRFRVTLTIEENADPGNVAEWEGFETLGETLESIRETKLGLPDRLAQRRLVGEFDARWIATSGSGASSISAVFDAGHTAYGCGELEKQKESMEELFREMQPEKGDRSKLDRIMGGDPPDGAG